MSILDEQKVSAIELALIPSSDRMKLGMTISESCTVLNARTAIPNLIETVRMAWGRNELLRQIADDWKETAGLMSHQALELENKNKILLRTLQEIASGEYTTRDMKELARTAIEMTCNTQEDGRT